jgi:hypothetical protein
VLPLRIPTVLRPLNDFFYKKKIMIAQSACISCALQLFWYAAKVLCWPYRGVWESRVVVDSHCVF